jgi:SM-20-related protein
MIDYSELVEQIYARGYHIADEFLADDHASQLQEAALQRKVDCQFRQARTGSGAQVANHPELRRDQIHWLDESSEHPSIQALFSAVGDISVALNQALFLGLVDFETHFALYSPGSFYKKHVDQFQTCQDRQISCVYYLNTEWQPSFGGELLLYDHDDALLQKVLPLANRLVCFSSTLPHEVAVTNQPRLSLAGWMKTRNART